MPRAVPPGYMVPNATANRFRPGTYAIDSATLVRDGISRDLTYDTTESDLDLRGDPRLERLGVFAEGLRNRYANPISLDYIPNVQDRHKKTTDELMRAVHDTYGDYSTETRDSPDAMNAGERLAAQRRRNFFGDTDGTPRLREMERNSLTCRHLGPILSYVLERGGVRNRLVSSYVNEITNDHGTFVLNPDTPLNDPNDPSRRRFNGYHAYIFTEEGAIVESTLTPQPNVSAYFPVENGVTAEQIVQNGLSAITHNRVYGGGTGNGSINLTRVRQGQRLEVERFNDQMGFRRALGLTDPAVRAREVATYLDMNSPYVNNTPDGEGIRPINILMRYDTAQDAANAIRLLNTPGITVNTTPNENTPLHLGALHHNERAIEVVRLLLEKGANINARNRGRGTPLHNAYGEEMARFLLDHGAQIGAIDGYGNTSLFYAAQRDATPLVRLLLDRQANVNTTNSAGETPLFYAVTNNQEQNIRLLLDRGAQINMRDNRGHTAIHYAIENGLREGNRNTALLLLSRGARVDDADRAALTALVAPTVAPPAHHGQNITVSQNVLPAAPLVNLLENNPNAPQFQIALAQYRDADHRPAAPSGNPSGIDTPPVPMISDPRSLA